MLQWLYSSSPIEYKSTLQKMEKRIDDIYIEKADELVWGLQHKPVYTAGTSAKPNELLSSSIPVLYVNRGGRFTYHGPGQLTLYIMLNLKKRNLCDISNFIVILENWGKKVLKELNVDAYTNNNHGLWVLHKKITSKIMFVGIHVRRWISYHGISFNVSPDLNYFKEIIPCGLSDPIISLKTLGIDIAPEAIFKLFKKTNPF
ncbi:MAG: lipoyl(octanoyl) transferase LipB [Alphaproteobacteria bacterium]